MCGIVGLYSKNTISEKNVSEIEDASKLLKHRGPDSLGIWNDDKIVLAHTKLSILDLSNKSNQPIQRGYVVVALNGEIYNYKKLIEKYNLKQCNFDADVIAELYILKGISFVHEIEGDFAISIYDRRIKKLHLIRDRLGVKQIIYTKTENDLYFASEVKSFNAVSDINLIPNVPKICTDLTMWFWADKEQTYFENIFHVAPGEYIAVDRDSFERVRYWDIDKDRYNNASLNMVEDTLLESTLNRLQGVVKHATLLSGGLDSSLLTAMVSQNSKLVTSYTIEYDDYNNNIDLHYSNEVAKHLKNINHKINHVFSKDITLEKLDMVTYHLEEVVWDKVYFSMFANYSNARNDGFRIIINGQGSDEVWLGYLHDFPMYTYKKQDFSSDNLMKHFINKYIGDKQALTPYALEIIENSVIKTISNNIPNDWLEGFPLDSVAYWACKTYLQSNLIQEDRMSMASSVECRVPFTDYRLVDLAFSFSPDKKVLNGNEKYPLKEIARKHIPLSVCSRKKLAFVNPKNKYNNTIIDYYNRNFNEIFDNGFIRDIFNDKFVSIAANTDNINNKEFIWKLVAIHRFIKLFKNATNKFVL